MSNSTKDKRYAVPPKLPCYVFKELPPIYLTTPIALLFCLFIAFCELDSLTLLLTLVIGALFIGLLIWESLTTVYKVHLNDRTVKVSYGLFQKRHLSLARSSIFIDEFKSPHRSSLNDYSQHYSYKVCLIPENGAAWREKDISHTGNLTTTATYTASPVPQSFRKIDNIPLSPIIYCPINLREYVEAIQSQLSVPLNMVFSSEKITEDYITGEYQAGLKSK